MHIITYYAPNPASWVSHFSSRTVFAVPYPELRFILTWNTRRRFPGFPYSTRQEHVCCGTHRGNAATRAHLELATGQSYRGRYRILSAFDQLCENWDTWMIWCKFSYSFLKVLIPRILFTSSLLFAIRIEVSAACFRCRSSASLRRKYTSSSPCSLLSNDFVPVLRGRARPPLRDMDRTNVDLRDEIDRSISSFCELLNIWFRLILQ
jgi:hypothetical protein